jgi:hypothetical protein
MRTNGHFRLWLASLLILGGGICCWAQETPDAELAPAAVADADADEAKPLREQTVFIPYKRLR